MTDSSKTNYNAQEEVVSALYAFSMAQQTRQHDTKYGTVSLNLAAVGEALSRIMDAFGYEVERVD